LRFLNAIIAFALVVVCAPVQASVVDFYAQSERLASGSLTFGAGKVMTGLDGSVVVYGPVDGSGVCAADASGACSDQIELIFFGPVQGLSFAVDASEDAGDVTMTVVDEAGSATQVAVPSAALGSRLAVSGAVRSVSVAADSGTVGLSKIGFPEGSTLTRRGRSALGPRPDFSAAILSDLQRLDLLALGRTGYLPGPLVFDDAVFTTPGGGEFYIYEPFQVPGVPRGGVICAAERVNGDDFCTGDFTVTFGDYVSDLKFQSFLAEDRDLTKIYIWSDDILLGTETVTTETTVDLTGYTGITRLFFEDHSAVERGAAGIAYGNFEFRTYVDFLRPVPVPSGLVLGLSGLAVLGAFGARRRRKAVE